MPYNYYCTHCGQLISQETVLFNMQNLVLEDDTQSFETFSMYMTLQQINQLIARGTPLENGYRLIRLSFTEVMQIISGGCNLKKPELASLTLEQIKEYLRPVMEEGPVVKQPKKKKSSGLNFAMKSVMVEADAEEEEEEEAAPAKAEQKEIPPAIQALSTLWGGTAGDQTVEIKIRGELELLKNAFGDQEYIDIQITERIEEDNQHKPVVVGYQLIYPKSDKHSIYRLRTCPKCHSHIYEQAGRAEHQTVVFMGTRGSGKTSAILAMTHYLHKSSHPIWEKCMPVDQLSSFLDGGRAKLVKELDDFEVGIAPEKTDATDRTKAYSSTFWFQNVETGGHLLTLTDMPGELMSSKENPNSIDEVGLLNSHKAALCCDAFVLCFDATTVFKATADEDGNPLNQEIRNNARNEVVALVDKLNQLQRLRADMIRERDGAKANGNYAPTLIMITKDTTIESQEAKPELRSPIAMERLYCFQAEREFIQANKVYNSILETISQYEKLRRAYHAMLRCSPFGYAAPSWEEVKKANKPHHQPTTKNVEDAVKWLLKLVGVIPAPGYLETDDGFLTKENYRIVRVQYRSDKPKEGEELEEALSRCTLFENPGLFDEQVLEAHTEGFFAKLRLKTSMVNPLLHNDSDPR